MVRTDSGESENRIPSSLKSCQATKSCDTATRGAAESLFCVSVISTGQHEIAPFGPGLLLLAGAGDLRFEWRHSGMSAVSPSPLLRAASLLLEPAAMLVCEPAIAGSAHAITHANYRDPQRNRNGHPCPNNVPSRIHLLRTIHLPQSGGWEFLSPATAWAD
jgi:hypothetical protein